MSFTSLSIIIFSLVALTMFIHIRKGYKKGLSTSVTNLCVIMVSAVLGAFLAMLIGLLLPDSLVELLLDSTVGDMTGNMAGLENAIAILVRMIFTLLLFIPCFFTVRLFIAVPVKIVLAVVSSRKDSNVDYRGENEDLYVKDHKITGALIGALAGFVMSVICQAPLVGVISAVTQSVDFVEDAAGEEFIDSDIMDSIDYLSDDFSVAVIYSCGGKTVFNFATSTVVDGDMVCLNDELEAIYSIDIDEFSALLEFDSSASENSRRIKNLVAKIDESKIMKLAFVDTVKGLSTAWLQNSDYMGVSRPSIGSDSAVNDVIDQLLLVCSTTDSAHIIADITTLVNISSLFADYKEVFNHGSYEDVVNLIVSESLLDRAKAELNKNPRMAKVSSTLDDVLMQIIAEEVCDSGYLEEDRDVFYDEIASILSSTAHLSGTGRLNKVVEQVKIAFSGYGVYVPDELYEQISKQLIEDIDTFGSDVTYEDIYEYFENLAVGDEESGSPFSAQ